MDRRPLAESSASRETTISDWLRQPADHGMRVGSDRVPDHHTSHEACPAVGRAPGDLYAYLLGQYLGDGSISRVSRWSHRLRVTCCNDYPEIMRECRLAMSAVGPGPVTSVTYSGCTDLCSNSAHWPCLFPQHGRGKKHERPIVLAGWQDEIARRHPEMLLRGLIHSDGCRVINRVKVAGKTYAYPRYFFNNYSPDILRIFGEACDRIGVDYRPNRWFSLSIARRESVAILDVIVGAKR